MSEPLPNNGDSNISLASSTQASTVSSLPTSDMESNLDTVQDVESMNGDEAVKDEKSKDETKDDDSSGAVNNGVSTDAFLTTRECDLTTVTSPVIPLPPDESAQDASDVVMETTTPADIKELQTLPSPTSVQSEEAKEKTETKDLNLPTNLDKREDDPNKEDASKQENSSANTAAIAEPVKAKAEEFTFKIPQLLGQFTKASNSDNSATNVSVTAATPSIVEDSEQSDLISDTADPSLEPDAKSDSERGDKTENITPGVEQTDTSTPASDETPQSVEATQPSDCKDKSEAMNTTNEQNVEQATAVDGESVTNDNSDTNAPEDDKASEKVSSDVEMKDEDSVTSDTTKSSSRKRRNSAGSAADSATGAADGEDADTPHHVTADQVFEYQWPPDKTSEYFFLQEQISEYLTVKSFKRKYPDLQRRPVEVQERMFLREKGIVTETQCDLGLTALKSEEVYDLMLKDYSEKYQDYVKVLQEKERRTISEKHKEYGMPKVDKGKMKEYMKKAVKSAADFNSHFMRELREERKAYFDLQTFQVMYPCGQMKKLPPEMTKPSAYPVALIPGQFQEHYKKYTPQELKYFPLNTVLYDPPKSLSTIYAKPKQEGESDSEESITSDASLDSVHSSSSGSSHQSSASSNQEQEELSCHICSRGADKNVSGEAEDLVTCSECARSGHPSCLEITDEMIPMIKTYAWQCMECKTCVECMDPYDEDKMMFCDHCDRGYHTFCVGLRSIPTGRWECPSCRPDEPKPKQRRTRTR